MKHKGTSTMIEDIHSQLMQEPDTQDDMDLHASADRKKKGDQTSHS